jgi:hypothetical protein
MQLGKPAAKWNLSLKVKLAEAPAARAGFSTGWTLFVNV